MFRNYLKTAWRNLTRNRTFSLINIGGLGIGMAITLLIGLWIHEELSFNKYHKHYDDIVQVMQHQHFGGEVHTDKAVPMPLGPAIRNEYGAGFKYVVASSWTNLHVLSFAERSFSRAGNFMEEDAPAMLSLQMVAGRTTDFRDRSSVFLSASLATSLFGDDVALGRIVKLDSVDLKVTGVYEDIPDNSSFHDLAFIAPWQLYADQPENQEASRDWNQNSFQLFAQVTDGSKISNISARIRDVKMKALGDDGRQQKPAVFLQPMSRWHLYADFKNGVNIGGAIEYVWMFAIIGAFILLLACINFMNLSTASSERRAKEVGVRKAVGSMRRQLIGQFYAESLAAVLLAFILSLALVQLSLPALRAITGREVSIMWASPVMWGASVVTIIVTGLIAGSYPAIYLSSFRPVKVLKGTYKGGRYAAMPRKILVVLQFSVSVILIIGTITVYRQVQYAQSRPVGYSKEGLILCRPYSEDYHNHFDALRNDLLLTDMVMEVAESSNSITKGSRTSGGLKWKGKPAEMQDEFTTVGVSAGYGRTVGWQFVAGGDFTGGKSDSNGLIINETAARYMGMQDPVGQQVIWDKTYTIIGVIRDVVMTSPFEPVKQALYTITPRAGYLNFRIYPHINMARAVATIEAVCKKYSPAAPFDYAFADRAYAGKFSEEQRISRLATVLATLAIFISCIGLFGLASYVAEQRTKEIGIRKVLGASVYALWRLQSGEFLSLVAISLLIAIPVASFYMHAWLENYHYRVELSWWIFGAAGAAAVFITLLTVSFHGVRSAMANPVKSLRTE